MLNDFFFKKLMTLIDMSDKQVWMIRGVLYTLCLGMVWQKVFFDIAFVLKRCFVLISQKQ